MRIAITSTEGKINKLAITRTVLVLSLLLGCRINDQIYTKGNQSSANFSGEQAYQYTLQQVALGPRTPGSQAHRQFIDWAEYRLRSFEWNTELQRTTNGEHPIINIIARRGSGRPWVILGAHYDSRLLADRDPDPEKRGLPVPGANDGASGVSVLMELARVIPKSLEMRIDIVLFDAEDNGGINDRDWAMGSRKFVSSLNDHPDAVIVLDMIGDEDLNVYIEESSDKDLAYEIWDIANQLGHEEYFISQTRHNIIDDHTPFLLEGIPAVLVIDFDYPYWHTTEDTIDKVSAKSLEILGSTIMEWLKNQ